MQISIGIIGSTFTPLFLNQWSSLLFDLARENYSISVTFSDNINTLYEQMKSIEECEKCLIMTSDTCFQSKDIIKLLKSPHDITTALFLDSSLKKYAIEHPDELVKLDPETVNKIIDLEIDEETKEVSCKKSEYIKVKSCKGNLFCATHSSISKYTNCSEMFEQNEIYADGLCRVGIVRTVVQ